MPDVPAPLLPDHLLCHCRVLTDRYAMLPLLPKGRVFVEVGVAIGDFTETVLRTCQPSRFVGIDDFRMHTWPMSWGGRPVAEIFAGRTHAEFYRARFAEPIRQDRMLVMHDDSAAALANLGDGTIDIAYIDADHSYHSVRRELEIVQRKMRPDGLIIMNDYTLVDVAGSGEPYGVIQATNEFMIEQGWEMLYLALQSHMYCDVALRRAGVRDRADPSPRRAALQRLLRRP